MPDKNLLQGNLDLILPSVLERGQMYGLEISKEVAAQSGDYFKFSLGSLYPALHRLEQAGQITGEFRTPERGGSPVKYYQLTENGKKQLELKRQEFERFNTAIRGLWNAS
jgi:PadR family transcriptional regulator, regulatory protein PadR